MRIEDMGRRVFIPGFSWGCSKATSTFASLHQPSLALLVVAAVIFIGIDKRGILKEKAEKSFCNKSSPCSTCPKKSLPCLTLWHYQTNRWAFKTGTYGTSCSCCTKLNWEIGLNAHYIVPVNNNIPPVYIWCCLLYL